MKEYKSNIDFLADMNISPLSVEKLKTKGWEILRVSEILPSYSEDELILEYAKKNCRFLITQDLDFSSLLVYGHF
jgi:predicted nuclease of predicted toxin-antitoxin system